MRRLLFIAILTGGVGLAAQVHVQPQFKDGNQLVRPEGYHRWVFVGSSLGMSYRKEAGRQDQPEFHNVYISPDAYRVFRETGKFPEGTIMILEIVSSGGNASINKAGKFEDKILGIDASVKDSKHFPEKWAYYSFIGKNGEALAKAKPFPKQACWSCHNSHGEVDNVFVQFYPVLREARAMSTHKGR